MRQWWVLTTRGLASIVRSGEIVFALASPVVLAVCFYIPLKSQMNQTMDYASFLMPVIALQATAFVASAAAVRVAFDRVNGINTRFRTLPMGLMTPPSARLAANAVLLVASLFCAALVSLIIGWRPHGGVAGTAGLFALAFAVGVALVLIADGIGLLAGTPEATSQVLTLPVLVLGMLSTGFMPVEKFPDWVEPFVRNQPISAFADAMRALNTGSAGSIVPALWWAAGLLAVGAALVVVATGRVRR
ncbi:ABC transporter permease [Gordonia crocea]|uniref:Doxorubicin resistance ABC transporter permease protein DrrB n=1 Tax=Gordonia crocea TaxID=589162 RepID=A0A7I9V2H7_9ACTN|nr:ABC transporter permease [Gordonia crocea]GED99416.1 doxorubicin resistance ABC transporter permease protein DrrB [Gordonia crocea]